MNEPLVVRPARPSDLAALPALEKAADAVFADHGIWPLPQPPDDAAAQAAFTDAAAVLVAGRPPVGFARLQLIDTATAEPVAHLDQLSVDPAFTRRGLGTALVQAACQWAARAGCAAVTLTTFEHVPFNAPFYARLGFTVIVVIGDSGVIGDSDDDDDDEIPAVLARLRRREAALGLDALGARVAMRRTLHAT